MRLVTALLTALLLAGCSEAPRSEEDCGADEDFNPHEARCVVAVEPDHEACNAWLDGGADGELAPIVCTARSDGKAWLDSSLTASSDYRITVRDGNGRVVYDRSVQFGGAVELRGTAGTWTLEVDFRDAAGSGRIVLWG